MRRMYSEQELTKVIKEVFDAELASGALDSKVSDTVDAYLVEHPVDVTALEGQDVELNSLDATGLITGGEIVEKMSGYSFASMEAPSNLTVEPIYSGIVKNGNKLTLVFAFNMTRTDTVDSGFGFYYTVPQSVADKLYPTTIGGYDFLSVGEYGAWSSNSATKPLKAYSVKSGLSIAFGTNIADINELTLNTKYYCRIEVTFLLSDSLVPEE